MNLVNELQVSAERDDVLTVLRKTKRLASKLGRQDIAEWLRSEQEGYGHNQIVPDYRQIRSTLAMNTNSYIPAGFGFVRNGLQELSDFPVNAARSVVDPISSILTWVEGLTKGHGI